MILKPENINVLIACEYSGLVYNAFENLGFNVLSCDLLDAEHNGNHYKGDIRDVLDGPWNVIIAFPPCTYLCNAQLHLCSPGSLRKEEQIKALAFFKLFLDHPAKFICVENPRGVIPRYFGTWSQTIQPWHFGDPYTKHINLWLKNLPPLISTRYSPGRKHISNHTNSKMSPALKSKIHSKFYPGIADAMANQWNSVILNCPRYVYEKVQSV